MESVRGGFSGRGYGGVFNLKVEGSSGDGLQRPRLDDPQGSPDDPQPRLDEHMECAIEDYERAIAARWTDYLPSGVQSWPPLAKYPESESKEACWSSPGYSSSGLPSRRPLDEYPGMVRSVWKLLTLKLILS